MHFPTNPTVSPSCNVSHGEVLFDCIANPDAAGWDLARVEGSGAWTAYPGGAPANVACALAKLGVPASFVGAVGRDKEGESRGGSLVAPSAWGREGGEGGGVFSLVFGVVAAAAVVVTVVVVDIFLLSTVGGVRYVGV